MKDFKEYLERYAKQYNVAPLIALTHSIVKEYGYTIGLSVDQMMQVAKEISNVKEKD